MIKEVSPPGWGHTKAEKEKTKPEKPKSKIGGTAHAMKLAQKRGDIPKNMNIFALMWSMKNKGDKPHYKPGVKDKLKGKYKGPEGQNEMIDPKKIRNYKNVSNAVVAKADKEAQKVKDKEQKGTLEFPQMPTEESTEQDDMIQKVVEYIKTNGKRRKTAGGDGRRKENHKDVEEASAGELELANAKKSDKKQQGGSLKHKVWPASASMKMPKEALDTWHPDPEKDKGSTSMKHFVKAVKHHDAQKKKPVKKEELELDELESLKSVAATLKPGGSYHGKKDKKGNWVGRKAEELETEANGPKTLSITPKGEKALKKGDQKLSITKKGISALKKGDNKKGVRKMVTARGTFYAKEDYVSHFGDVLRQAIEEAKKVNAIDTINKIVKTKTMGKLHGQKVDLFTASAIQQVYNALNKKNQEKMVSVMSKDVHGLLKMADFSMKQMKR